MDCYEAVSGHPNACDLLPARRACIAICPTVMPKYEKAKWRSERQETSNA